MGMGFSRPNKTERVVMRPPPPTFGVSPSYTQPLSFMASATRAMDTM